MKLGVAMIPWSIAAAMIALGLSVPVLGPIYFGLSPTDNAVLSGALGGGLIGAGGTLFATLVANLLQRRAEREDREQKIINTKKLIAAELVNIAAGLIAAEQTMKAAIETIEAGGRVSPLENLSREMPRGTPVTDSLGQGLLLLDADSIDTLVTLKANLERTGEEMLEVTSGRRMFGLLTAGQVRAGIQHDMSILAQCFERFAPERKLAFSNKEPELASVLLRRIAAE